MSDHFKALLEKLTTAGIDFVLVGGLAAVTHGSAYATYDVDVSYERSPENVRRLVKLLKTIKATLRGAPPNLPFLLDEKSILMGMNFTLQTTLGDLDLLGEMSGIGNYSEAKKYSEPLDLYGLKIHVLSLDGLIKTKQAVHRPKDMMHLKELEAIRAMKRNA